MRKFLLAIIILALLGVAVSSYALWQHYAPLGAAFCNLGETFSCDLVNKSAFSEAFGIPVALIGILGYASMGVLAVVAKKTRAGKHRALRRSESSSDGKTPDVEERESGHPHVLSWLLVASLAGLAFSLYLTYVELFVIGAICVLCVTSQTLILAITVLAWFSWRQGRLAPYG